MVLGSNGPGRVGRRRFRIGVEPPFGVAPPSFATHSEHNNQSQLSPMVLGSNGPGRVGRRRFRIGVEPPFGVAPPSFATHSEHNNQSQLSPLVLGSNGPGRGLHAPHWTVRVWRRSRETRLVSGANGGRRRFRIGVEPPFGVAPPSFATHSEHNNQSWD